LGREPFALVVVVQIRVDAWIGSFATCGVCCWEIPEQTLDLGRAGDGGVPGTVYLSPGAEGHFWAGDIEGSRGIRGGHEDHFEDFGDSERFKRFRRCHGEVCFSVKLFL